MSEIDLKPSNMLLMTGVASSRGHRQGHRAGHAGTGRCRECCSGHWLRFRRSEHVVAGLVPRVANQSEHNRKADDPNHSGERWGAFTPFSLGQGWSWLCWAICAAGRGRVRPPPAG